MPQTRTSHTEGRYTVVYEGDPSGVNILAGEPAPGKAVGVGLGDLAELYDREDRRVAAEIAALVAALKMAQSALAMLTAPDQIQATSVAQAWAQAVEAEARARVALSKIEGR